MKPVVGQNVQYNSHLDIEGKMIVQAAIIVQVYENIEGPTQVGLVVFGSLSEGENTLYKSPVPMGEDEGTWKYLPISAYFPMIFGVPVYENWDYYKGHETISKRGGK